MSLFYMTSWSLVMIVALGFWRLRTWRQTLLLCLITLLLLLLTQASFVQLSAQAGLDPDQIATAPAAYLAAGPVGWLALLVMPCGWLSPVLGFSIVRRMDRRLVELELE